MMKALLLAAAFATLCAAEIDQHIVGGEIATYGEHPYICSLERCIVGNFLCSHSCGSVIFNQNTLVTAAHCVDGASASTLRVKCGLQSLSSQDQYQVQRDVTSFTMHPQWSPNGDGYPNDIATIRLSSPLTFNSHISPATFATSGSFEGQSCKLTGWGRTVGGGSTATQLKKVNMEKISNANCAEQWAKVTGAAILDSHICFFRGDGYSACNGDSGGPVRCGDILTGVTSWGISTCDGTLPSVYTRISSFYNWIVANSS